MFRFLRLWRRFVFLSFIAANLGYASSFDAPPTEGADFVYPLSPSAVVIIRTDDQSFDEQTFVKEEDETWHLYRRQRGQSGDCGEGYFIRTTKEDAYGKVLSVNEQIYDHDEHLLSETLTGNLSGSGQTDSYSRHYRYNEKGLLVESTEDNHFTVRHEYNDAGKVTAKWLLDHGSVVGRLFMQYDPQGRVCRTDIDDGFGEEAADLSGVSCRKIISFTFHEDQVITQEGYLDLVTGEEILLKKTVESYDVNGDLSQQIAYDGLGDYWFSRYIDRDSQAKTISILDSTGCSVCYEFDDNGALKLSQGRRHFHHINEPSNPNNDEQIIFSGDEEAIRYDERGNIAATVDAAGNETHYSYDPFNRLVRVTYPAVLDDEDLPYHPKVCRQYDVNDHIVSVTDGDGQQLLIQYTIRGKKAAIVYPDGTRESFLYNGDGTLSSATNASGITICYQYDYLSRITQKDLYDSEGSLLKTEKYSYSLFGLTSHTDTRGITTFFEYDQAGRLSGAKREVDGKTLTVRLSYDARGHLAKKEETFGPSKDDHVITVYHRGDDDTLVASTIETAEGQPQLHHDVSPPKENPAEEQTSYIVNDLEQKVRQTLSIGPSGVMTYTTYDAMGRPETIEKQAPDGTLIFRQLMRYDGVGRKTLQADALIEEGRVTGTVKTLWRYGPKGRLETVIEDSNTLCSAQTRYLYDTCGRLATIVKPDGTQIEHRYDAVGRLSLKYGSDESFAYRYEYDGDSNLKAVHDLLYGTATYREHTRSGQVASETLSNGLSLHSEYDAKGRRVRLQLTDGSSVAYRYKGALLKDIHRVNKEGLPQYCHQYDSFDLSGRLRTARLIGNLGTAGYRWHSSLKKLSAVTTLFWAEEIPEAAFDVNGNITQTETADILGGTSCHFAYDDCQRLTYEWGVEEHSYGYDSLENRVTIDHTRCGIIGRSQLVQQGDSRFTYDMSGNLVKKEQGNETTLFTYDALNRLIQIIKPKDFKLCYVYDAFDRRLSEKSWRWDTLSLAWIPAKDHSFLYDGDDEIGVVDNQGAIRQLRILGLGHGAEIGASVAIEVTDDEGATQKFAPIHNGRGSVTCLVDVEQGKPVELYRYTGFGSEQIFDEQGRPITESAIGNPWRFSSKHVDQLSGLVYFGKRYYDPSIGRWITKDPMGYFDGPNLYAYVHNNPLNHIDHYGLWSIGSFFQDVTELWNAAVNAVGEVIDGSYQYLCDQLGVLEDLQKFGSEAVKRTVGDIVYFLMGNNAEPDLTSSLGMGEVSPQVRVTYLNGLLSPFDYHLQQMESLSKAHGSVNIHYVYRGTRGWTWDMTQAMLIKVGGYVSPYARMLATKWKALIKEMGGPAAGGTIYHYTHSMGGSDTHHALNLMTPEEQQMIRVYAFGPAKFVTSNNCAYAINYVSGRDGVSLFDPIGYWRSKNTSYNCNIQIIGSIFDGIPYLEHLFCCETYREIWEQLGKEFVEKYGRVDTTQ